MMGRRLGSLLSSRRAGLFAAGLSFLLACGPAQAPKEPDQGGASASASASAPASASASASAPASGAGTSEVAAGMMGTLTEEQFKALHQLTGDKAPPPRGEKVTIDGTTAYLSLPKGKSAPLPGLIVIHEWWGMNEHIQHWA